MEYQNNLKNKILKYTKNINKANFVKIKIIMGSLQKKDIVMFALQRFL